MKKTFALTHPKIQLSRLVESVKFDIKKYLKRERNKALPLDADYWDFDCKFGITEADAQVVHLGGLNKCLDKAEKAEQATCYIEILAKPGYRQFVAAEDAPDATQD